MALALDRRGFSIRRITFALRRWRSSAKNIRALAPVGSTVGPMLLSNVGPNSTVAEVFKLYPAYIL